MGKPKIKKVSQKRYDRLSKRAAKSVGDRLVGGGDLGVVGKYSKKGKIKKAFVSKDRIETPTPMPTLQTIGKPTVRRRSGMIVEKSIKSFSRFPGRPLSGKMEAINSPISKRTPMESKYGGTLLPEVTITAPAHKPKVDKIMSPLASRGKMSVSNTIKSTPLVKKEKIVKRKKNKK